MEEVAFDLIDVYPPVEPPPFASGHISSAARPDLCLESQLVKRSVGVAMCDTQGGQVGGGFHS